MQLWVSRIVVRQLDEEIRLGLWGVQGQVGELDSWGPGVEEEAQGGNQKEVPATAVGEEKVGWSHMERMCNGEFGVSGVYYRLRPTERNVTDGGWFFMRSATGWSVISIPQPATEWLSSQNEDESWVGDHKQGRRLGADWEDPMRRRLPQGKGDLEFKKIVQMR